MGHPRLAAALCALAVLFVSTATSTPPGYGPPRPGTEDNGLTENESATLWSRDDDRSITNDAYRAAYGENRTAIQEVANATDLTFKRPPATAATWTRHDFADLHAGGSDESIHPPGADLESAGIIQDAHATLFAVQPSTRVHHDATTDTLYVAPNGTARGLVDYRIGLPSAGTGPNTTVRWQPDGHGITEVRLEHDGRVVARTDGTHTPQLDYRLIDGDTTGDTSTLTLAADIHVAGRLVTINRSVNRTTRETERIDETVTVEDSVPVQVYDLEATVYRAEFPDGDAGVAVFQNGPWQGYRLTENGSARVRGVWRFYTARDTQWDRLIVAKQNDSETIASPAHPVSVHAYPSELGPRPDPAGVGPSLQIVWGATADSPAGALGPNVAVEVVEAPYTASYGMAVRHTTVAPDGPTVRGIVRGVTANVTTATDGVQQVRRSNLTATVVDRSGDTRTVRFDLRDARTGTPIDLGGSNYRGVPILPDDRDGVIVVDGKRYETNASGQVTVTLTSRGLYTARYEPGGWLDHDPAYVGDTAIVRLHPLLTVDGWLALLTNSVLALLPFGVALYLGVHLGRLLEHDSHP